MNRSTTPMVAIVLLVVGVLGMAATLFFVQPRGPVGPGMGTGRMDAMFIEQMIPHHEDAIAMAEIALRRAEHPEITQLAENVIRTQSEEITQMRGWYREWFGVDVPDFDGSFGMMGRGSPGMMGGMMRGAVADLDVLETADEFDRLFIESMVPHHEMGIMMSRMIWNATDRPEMRGLAQSIIQSQSEEIDDMREWYEEWYGR